MKLSSDQAEVLRLYTVDFLTVKAIAQRRRTSTQAVSKIIRKLKLKGVPLFNRRGGGYQGGGYPPPSGYQARGAFSSDSEGKVRLHAQQLRLPLISCGSSYAQLVGRFLTVGRVHVRFWKGAVELYLLAGDPGFLGRDEVEAEGLSFAFWLAFIKDLERSAKVTLLRPQGVSVRVVKAHYAVVHSGLAFDQIRRDQALRLVGGDGKEYFLIDNSLKLYEHEYPHPERARRDLAEIEPFIRDWHEHPDTPVQSEVWKVLAAQVHASGLLSEGMTALIEILKRRFGGDWE